MMSSTLGVTVFAVGALVFAEAFQPSVVPAYCSEDSVNISSSHIPTKSIPPLSAFELSQVGSLNQVQLILRHGSRTPYSAHACWENYDVEWNNCGVTTLMEASPSYTDPDRPYSWLYRKLYDGSDNYLGGNCHTGQLIHDGYIQEVVNGRLLNEAYMSNSNPNLNLFDTTTSPEIDYSLIYLRSDDDERTVMSGQVLMSSMFDEYLSNDAAAESILEWHTGDYGLDTLYPNHEVCPYLDVIQANAGASTDFQLLNTSAHTASMSESLDAILGEGYWMWEKSELLDCYMTTVCTGREIPDGNGTGGVTMNDK